MDTLTQKASKIRLLVLDVDGVLSDGKIYTSASGEAFKRFDVKDGLGVKMVLRNGIDVAIITAKSSEIVRYRAAELGIETVYQGVPDKTIALKELLQTKGLTYDEVAYVGDDLPDLAVMREVGLTACPSNATAVIRDEVDFVLSRAGGDGAVREFTDFILEAQGKMQETLEKMFLHPDTQARHRY